MDDSNAYDGGRGIASRSQPRRPFELSMEESSAPPTPPMESTDSPQPQSPGSTVPALTPARNHSIMNLTSSTLLGIYQPTGYAADAESDGQATPWGTGAQTPVDNRSGSFDFTKAAIPDMVIQENPNGFVRTRKINDTGVRPRKGSRRSFLPVLARDLALFSLGTIYGMIIVRLHDRSAIVPVKVEAVDRSGWPYLAFWGVVAILVGEALPWIDTFWAPSIADKAEETPESTRQRHRSIVDSWNDVVRPVGAFFGIAFAVRKLPWQSTMQLSLTLALANPAIWYLVDRSPPGFIFSTLVALGGTAVLLIVNPAMVPSPPSSVEMRAAGGLANNTIYDAASDDLLLGTLSQDSIGVAVWIASVLFVSAVCFGNVGRRLARRV